MLVVVEGPDCARKSTLAQLLVDELKLREPGRPISLLHATPPTRHPLDEWELPLLDFRPLDARRRPRMLVCDRWHLGELVYPEVFNRSTRFDEPTFRHVELLLRSRGALLVVVTPEVDELRECLETRGDDYVGVDQIERIREGYVRVAARTSLPLVWLKDETLDRDLVRFVIGEALHHAGVAGGLLACNFLDGSYPSRTPVDENVVTYVGPRWPRLLLLGDVRRDLVDASRAERCADKRPAFMPYPGTSGHYLLSVLGDDLVEHEVGVANACDADDPRSLWLRLGQPPTVALGRNAQRVAPWARPAPHPQFWRRFHHHDRDEYRRLLLGT